VCNRLRLCLLDVGNIFAFLTYWFYCENWLMFNVTLLLAMNLQLKQQEYKMKIIEYETWFGDILKLITIILKLLTVML